MVSVIDKLQKRRLYPVTIAGETVHVQALRHKEFARVLGDLQADDAAFGFTIGHGLLNDDGSTVFSQGAEESDKDFGDRVIDSLNLPTDTRAELTETILRLSKGPTPEGLEKLKKS